MKIEGDKGITIKCSRCGSEDISTAIRLRRSRKKDKAIQIADPKDFYVDGWPLVLCNACLRNMAAVVTTPPPCSNPSHTDPVPAVIEAKVVTEGEHLSLAICKDCLEAAHSHVVDRLEIKWEIERLITAQKKHPVTVE